MLVECGKCGAPLDVAGDPASVQCSYCGLQNKLRRMRTLAVVTPPGWRPPGTWTPSGLEGRSGAALKYGAGAGMAVATGASGCAVLAFGGAILLATVVVVVVVAVGVSGPEGPHSIPGLDWDGAEPLLCGGNESVEIDGVTANLPGQVVVTAEGNCRLRITNSSLSGAQGVVASGNHPVVIMNSTITSEGVGIHVDGNRDLELIGTTVRAGGVGIEAEGNADVTLSGGLVQGVPTAVTTSGRAEIENRGAQMVDGPASP